MTRAINCSLMENALDYLRLAAEQVLGDDERMTKHAIATLGDGVELLLKARLDQRDWCLIFKDVDAATRDKYEKGDFESATFKQLVQRLKNLCDIELDPAAQDAIEKLRKERNRIRHFAIHVSHNEAVGQIADAFHFAIDFVANHLAEYSGSYQDTISELRSHLGKFSEFIRVRMDAIRPLIKKSDPSFVIKCPKCLQPALVADGDSVQCHFCRFHCSPSEGLDEWMSAFRPMRPKDWLIECPVHNCPNCFAETGFFTKDHRSGDAMAVCLRCGVSGKYRRCSRCDALFNGDDEDPMCHDCWDNLCHSDD